MRFTIQSTLGGCTIRRTEFHNMTELPVPMGAGDVTALLAGLLQEPEKHEVESGPVQIVRMEKGVSIRTKAGSVDIPWSHLFAIDGVPA